MDIKDAVLDEGVVIYPDKTITIHTDIVGDGSDHPVSVSVYTEKGLLKIAIKNEHHARILKLSKGFRIASLLVGE